MNNKPDLSLSNPNLDASKQFGAYKVGEFTNQNYRVVEDGVPARQDTNTNMLK